MGVTKCRDCGGTVSDRLSYCPHCGAPMRDDLPVDRRPGASKPSSGAGALRAFLISFLLILVVGGAIAGWYWYTYLRVPPVTTITDGLRQAAARYDTLGEFYGGIARCEKDGNPYYIDVTGNLVDAPDPSTPHTHEPDETGLMRIENGGKWGMVDCETRDTVIPASYSTLGNFYDGFALATLKFGDPSMPEYRCYYGYVDRTGADTFTPEQRADIDAARSAAERRAYLASLPHGVTARALGLPDGVVTARITVDSVGTYTLGFDRRGILVHYSCALIGHRDRHYGVTAGFPTSMTFEAADGRIVTSRYIRETDGEHRELIIRQSPDGRTRAGAVTYDPADDVTVTSFTFESLPALGSATVADTDPAGRPIRLTIPPATTATLSY